MKNNQSSDLGFIVFLVFAGLILIPLYFGVSDITELIRFGKIIIIVIIVLVVISIALVGFLIYRKKFRKPKIKKKMEVSEESEEQENTTKISIKENDNVTIVLPSKEEMEDGFLLKDDQIIGDLLDMKEKDEVIIDNELKNDLVELNNILNSKK